VGGVGWFTISRLGVSYFLSSVSDNLLKIIECRDRVGGDELGGEGIPLGNPSEELISSAGSILSCITMTCLRDTYLISSALPKDIIAYPCCINLYTEKSDDRI
jgi:hypothetical protein